MEKKTTRRRRRRMGVVTLISLLIILTQCSPLAIDRIPMSIQVANYTGFNVDTTSLVFGTVSQGGMAQRFVNVSNTFNKALQIDIQVEGELAEWATARINQKELLINQTETITVEIAVPLTAKQGNYTGELVLIFRK